VTKAGFLLQIDAPDLAMERVLLFQDMSDMEYAKLVEQHVAALNKALEGIPADRVRLHVCQTGDIARRSRNRLDTAMGQEGGLSPLAHPYGESVFTGHARR